MAEIRMKLNTTGLIGQAIEILKESGQDTTAVGFGLAQLHDHLHEVSKAPERAPELFELYVFDDESLKDSEYP